MDLLQHTAFTIMNHWSGYVTDGVLGILAVRQTNRSRRKPLVILGVIAPDVSCVGGCNDQYSPSPRNPAS